MRRNISLWMQRDVTRAPPRFENAKLSRKKNKKLVKMHIHDIDSAEDADDEVGGKNDDDDNEDIVFKKKEEEES